MSDGSGTTGERMRNYCINNKPRWCYRILICFLLIQGALFAQDFDRLKPKELPEGKKGELEKPDEPAKKIEGGDKVLISELKGLVFVESEDAITKEPLESKGITAPGIDLLQTEDFAALMDEFLGRPVTMNRLNKLARQVILFYRSRNRPVVDVILPEQNITGGTVQFIVIEGRLGEVKAEGNKWFDTDHLVEGIRLSRGDIIETDKVMEDIDWLNRNPFRRVDAVLEAGDEVGTTNLVLRTRDRFPFRAYVGYEDTGTEFTGKDRMIAGFNASNLIFRDDLLSYQFSGSGRVKRMQAHSFSYAVPLPWRDTVKVFGSHSNTYSSPDNLQLEGYSSQVGIRYSHPLPGTDIFDHSIEVGFDWKKSFNNLEFGIINFRRDTLTEVGQTVLGYSAGLEDPWGNTGFEATFYHGTGECFDRQDDVEYRNVRAFADPSYNYVRMRLNRTTNLPWGFTLSNDFTMQLADDNLLPSEQLGLGGYDSIRGFDYRILSGADEGWFIRNELYLPKMSLTKLLGLDQTDQLRFLAFWDHGIGKREYELPGEDINTPLSSIGWGFRYSFDRYLQVRFDWGFPMQKWNFSDQDDEIHISIIASY